MLLDDLSEVFGDATAIRLWRTYGGMARELGERARESADLGQRVGPNSDLIVGELLHAIEREHAGSLADLLLRRTMVGLGKDLGRTAAPLAADWLVRLGIWDEAGAAEEVEAYRQCIRRYAVPSPQGRSG